MTKNQKENPFEPPQERSEIRWLVPGESIHVKTNWEVHSGFTKYGETKFLKCEEVEGTKIDFVVPKALEHQLYLVFEELQGKPAEIVVTRNKNNTYEVSIVE